MILELPFWESKSEVQFTLCGALAKIVISQSQVMKLTISYLSFHERIFVRASSREWHGPNIGGIVELFACDEVIEKRLFLFSVYEPYPCIR